MNVVIGGDFLGWKDEKKQSFEKRSFYRFYKKKILVRVGGREVCLDFSY